MSVCSVDGCGRKKLARGWCATHYRRWRTQGDANINAPVRLQGSDAVQTNFWAKVEKTETCWNWTGAKSFDGYGHFSIGRKLVGAHRASYQFANGPVSKDLKIDHTCHNKACVNPAHMRVTTNKQNCENRSGPNRNGSSGVRGVTWNKRLRKWVAAVGSRGKSYHVGVFTELKEAEAAVIAKRNELFTHNELDRV